MKKVRFTETQIIPILKHLEAEMFRKDLRQERGDANRNHNYRPQTTVIVGYGDSPREDYLRSTSFCYGDPSGGGFSLLC